MDVSEAVTALRMGGQTKESKQQAPCSLCKILLNNKSDKDYLCSFLFQTFSFAVVRNGF